ncbi:MAG: hypothetical protein MUO61_03540 [Dehalococcoidia bacterium]|nr:hypothetical protein [Dehalococcoidia bacterium]
MNLSKYLEDKWLGMLKGVAYTAPTTYVGLIDDTADEAEMEGDTPLASEITGYTGNRKAITFGAISKAGTDPSEMTGDTAADIEFLVMPAPAGRSAKYLVVCDAATVGHCLGWSEITAGPKVWNTGDTFRILQDDITVKLD